MGPVTLAGSYAGEQAAHLDTQPVSVSSHFVHSSDINLKHQSSSHRKEGEDSRH
jgi:hypothetical protein